MKVIRIHAYGGPELMQLEDAPVPPCGAGDLLVRVVAAGVNPVDWKLRSGVMAAQTPKSFPTTLGFDAAGVVIAVGGEVSGFELGDEVCFYAAFARGGTRAEYVAVDASQAAKKPRTATFAAAAALPMGGQGRLDRLAWAGGHQAAGAVQHVRVHHARAAAGTAHAGLRLQLARSRAQVVGAEVRRAGAAPGHGDQRHRFRDDHASGPVRRDGAQPLEAQPGLATGGPCAHAAVPARRMPGQHVAW